MGGKRRLAKYIIPLFPEHHTYVEPFCGGAGLFFYKPEAPVEVLNDINGDLVNLYRVIKHHLEEFIRHFKWALVSRQEFMTFKKMDPTTLTDIQRATRFYYLQKMAFGSKPTSQTFGISAVSPPKLNLLRIEEDLSQAHLRLSRTYIEHLSWEACVTRYDRPDTLLYMDPPYWGTSGYGIEFPLTEYDRMATLAKTIKGKMIISVNDIREMRETFKGLNMDKVGINYTVGTSNKKRSSELIIRNW